MVRRSGPCPLSPPTLWVALLEAHQQGHTQFLMKRFFRRMARDTADAGHTVSSPTTQQEVNKMFPSPLTARMLRKRGVIKDH